MEELIKRLERVIATGAPDKDGMHPISAEMVLEVVKGLSEHGTNLAEVGTDLISRQAAIEALMSLTIYKSKREIVQAADKDENSWIGGVAECIDEIEDLPSAQPEWNNHTVACLLAETFGDDCACNFNGIDEWLPEKCEVIDSCPNPVGVACWEQFLKHRGERRQDE